MAVSTEETVRAVIVNALRDAWRDLGFDASPGNVKDYLLEHEDPALWAKYLNASIGGKNLARCWGVQVTARDEWFGMANTAKRTYSILVTGYYSKETRGEGVKALINGARIVRGAIHGLEQTLSETVDFSTGSSDLDVTEIDNVDLVPGVVLVGRLVYGAEKVRPDF